MKKFFKYCLLLAIPAVMSTSCSEDFLDRAPGNALSPATFWKTEADADLALTGCYRQLHNPYRLEEMWYWDCASDNQYNFHSQNFSKLCGGLLDDGSVRNHIYYPPKSVADCMTERKSRGG